MSGRIAVRFSDDSVHLMREFSIEPGQVERAVNERTQGILTREFSRLLTLWWFDDENGIFVDSTVTKKEPDAGGVTFREVVVQIAIRVKADLPAGRLKSVETPTWFMVVARSFGLAIKRESEPDTPPDFVYSGPLTKELYVAPDRPGGVLRLATLFPTLRAWDFLWFFDLPRYREWYRVAVGQSRMRTPPPDDEWLAHLKEYVRSIPTKHPDIVAKGGYPSAAAHSIIRMTLGDGWWRANVLKQTTGLLAHTDRRAQLRAQHLAEMFLNLRYVDGMVGRINQLKAGNLTSVMQEMETAQMVIRSGISFRFVEPSGVKRKDFEARIRLPDGREACLEVKGKDETTALSVNTILQTLKDAVKQVPKNVPAIFLVWLPNKWITDPNLEGALETATRRLYGQSRRAVATEFVWESWREAQDKDSAPKLTRWTTLREYPNFRSPHFEERNLNLLAPAVMLDSVYPWMTLDAFLMSVRSSGQPVKVQTERLYLI